MFPYGNPSTHYDTLGVEPLASTQEINDAYQELLFANRPDKTRLFGPLRRTRAEKATTEGKTAWTVLSDPAKRAEYDSTLPSDLFSSAQSSTKTNEPNMRSFNPRARNRQGSPSGDSFPRQPKSAAGGSGTMPGSSSEARSGAVHDEDTSSGTETADDAPAYAEAAYRYMQTSTGTVVDVAISNWRLRLNLSSKFRFINDVTDLSTLPNNDNTVSFQICLRRDMKSYESLAPSINEMTIKISKIANSMRISNLSTLFRETRHGKPTLTVTLRAEPCRQADSILPWEFGFDFDMNWQAHCSNRGTCLMFSREAPPSYMLTYVGPDSPKFMLKKEKNLKADMYLDLHGERLLKMVYGNVELWRLAAVGYKHEG